MGTLDRRLDRLTTISQRRQRRASSAAHHDYSALTPEQQFALMELLFEVERGRALSVWQRLRLEELLAAAGDPPA